MKIQVKEWVEILKAKFEKIKDNEANGGKDNNNMVHMILNAELDQIFELQSCIVCENLSHKFTFQI